MKTIRSYILKELERQFHPYGEVALSRLMSGQRNARIGVAKGLARITRTNHLIWMVGGSVADREAALERLAKRKGMILKDGRGRPRKGE